MPHLKIEAQTTAQLFDRALGLKLGGDAFWKHVNVLHNRATRETFETAKRLCLSRQENARVLGADVLCQLRKVWKTKMEQTESKLVFVAASRKLIRPMLRDKRTEVVRTAIYALGHLKDPQRAKRLARFAIHPNPDLRYAVAYALGGDSHPLSVRTLIRLMEDPDRDVRNWATFGLGSLGDPKKNDSPQIREAFIKRLGDTCLDARGEAMAGIARRKDERVIDIIQRELRGPDPSNYILSAAFEFGNPVFYPALEKLWRGIKCHGKKHSWWCMDLQFAIKACTPQNTKGRDIIQARSAWP